MSSLCLALALVVAQDRPCTPIPERIEIVRPNPLEIYPATEMVAYSFEEVVADADLVVEGAVRKLKTYMDADQCYLYTDYAIRGLAVLWGQLAPHDRPGEQAVVVSVIGGTAVINGNRVITAHSQLAPFENGEKVMLLLSRSRQEDKYELVGGTFGVLMAEPDGTIHARYRMIYGDMRKTKVTRADLVARIRKVKGR